MSGVRHDVCCNLLSMHTEDKAAVINDSVNAFTDTRRGAGHMLQEVHCFVDIQEPEKSVTKSYLR